MRIRLYEWSREWRHHPVLVESLRVDRSHPKEMVFLSFGAKQTRAICSTVFVFRPKCHVKTTAQSRVTEHHAHA